MSEADNERVVRAFFEALTRGRVDEMMALATDDLTWTLIGTTPISGTFRGKEAVLRDFFGPVGEVVDFDAGVEVAVEEILVTGDRVVARLAGKMQGRHGPYNNQYCHVMTLRDGQVAATVEYVDTVLVETALFGRSL